MASSQREWHHSVNGAPYTISTEKGHLDLDFINTSFSSKDMYWAKPLPLAQLKLMLDHSLTLGLYKGALAIPLPATDDVPSSPRTPSPTVESSEVGGLEQIGIARFSTDHVTVAYLTDVYVHPSYRAFGLGAWLMECCKEILDSMPYIRRAVLMSSPGATQAYYEKVLGFHDVRSEADNAICMMRRGPGLA